MPRRWRAAQLFLEECVQGFLLPFPTEPQRLAGLQVAHHRQELLLLCPSGSHPRPSAAAPACAWRRPTAPDSAGRSRAPCSPPSRTAAPLVAPPHSRTPGPPHLSNRLLNGALLGNSGIFSTFTPQSGHRTRYTSISTVVLELTPRQIAHRPFIDLVDRLNLRPQPEHTSFRFPRLRRTHSSRILFFSSISCRYTR